MNAAPLARPVSGALAPGRVVILAALNRELAGLRSRIRVERRWQEKNLRAAEGSIEGVPVVVASTGDGAQNAAAGARAVLSGRAVRGVIILGAAGALSARLEPGRVLVAREVIDGEEEVPAPDPLWLHRALRETGATSATFVCSRGLLCSARAKAEAFARLSSGTPAAVDLETAAFARAAAEHGAPYVALRAISDAAEESLPLDFNALRDRSGAVDNRRVLLAALRRPSLLPPLWRLRGRVALCSENLARAAVAILGGGTP